MRSFNVAYSFLAKDLFTNISRKIRGENKNLGQSFKDLDANVEKTGRRFKKSSDNMVKDLKKMAAGYLSFQSLKTFVRIGAEFETAVADLSAITGIAGKDLKFLSDESRRLAKTSVTSAPLVAEAFKMVASAKSELTKDPRALSMVTEQVLLLKNTGIEMRDAAEVVMSSLNQFGAGADQAARFVNVLAAGSKIGASEVSEAGQAIVKAGVAARMAGIDFEGLNAMVQVLAQSGIKAELAGTGLKTALLALETSKNSAWKPSIVGLSTALENLGKANLDATRLEKLFGREAINIGAIMIRDAALIKDWRIQMTGTNVAQEQLNAQMDTSAKRWEALGINVKDLLYQVFDKIEPTLSTATVAMSTFIGGMDTGKVSAFGESLAIVGNGMLAIGSALGSVISAVVSGISYVFGGIASIFKGVGTLIGEFIGALTTLDFSQFSNVADSFSVGGKFLGAFGGTDTAGGTGTAGVPAPYSIGAPVSTGSSSTTDINMNIMAPQGVVKSVQSRTTGDRDTNVGWNMVNG